jgi:NADPH:quinone reductase-like Zn-dependent oxidoreductase
MHGYGGVDQLYYEEVDEPRVAQPDEVVVRLKAAAINHIDIWNRMGVTGIAFEMPHILGADGAGIVVEVGENVANVKEGDAVCLYPPSGCGRCEFCLTDRDFMCIRLRALGERLEGTYAQFVKLPAQNCFPMPAGFTFEEAAAFPLVYITLWRMLIPNAKLKPGEPMLIIGIGFKFPVSRKKGPVTFAYDLALGTGAVKRGFRV